MNIKSIELFQELTGASDDIAKIFFDLKIKGKKFSEASCPVATYLSNKTQNIFYVSHYDYTVFDYFDNVIASGYIPENVIQFILDFDNGKYSELEIT